MNLSFLLMGLEEWFGDPIASVSIICMAFGLAFAILAKRITRAVRGTYSISTTDKIYQVFCILGLLLILAGLIMALVSASSRT